MKHPPFENTVTHLFKQAEEQGSSAAVAYKQDGAWHDISWEQYASDVHTAAAGLVKLGLGKGDTVCILGFNCYEWVVMDLAAIMIGAIPAGIYTTSSPEEVAYILNHSEARVLLLESTEQWNKIIAQQANLEHLKDVVSMIRCEDIADEMAMDWATFMGIGSDNDKAAVEKLYAASAEHEAATFIYTSGTTGPPKAVMLSNKNLVWTASQAADMIKLDATDSSLSYLPLSHIAEQMFTIHAPIIVGWKVYFATGILDVLENLKEVKPTVLFGVPRIWEKFYTGLKEKLGEASGLKEKIVNFSLKAGSENSADIFSGGDGGGWKYRLANKLLFGKVKDALGLSNLRVGVTGAAPINAEILKLFASLDIPILEVYGQSEGSGPTSFNRPRNNKPGSVGPAYPGTEVKIADDGEIMLKGPNVFLGYYKDQEGTDACLEDGWLYSGDVGKFDEDGFLYVTGRKKEILVTSGGKNIAPIPIEEDLKQIPAVAQAVMVGDNRNFCTALLTLDVGYLLKDKMGVDITDISPLELVNVLESKGKTVQGFAESAEILSEIQAGVDKVNSKYAQVENIRKFAVLPRDFTMADDEVTPTFKIKRSKIYAKWADTIDSLYTG
ncbi:MAG: long-chain fatty acid--CoA ligase [Gemmatimonadetes bacterium]|nr:long-chain fatty acid--CoA ligase [Gemmatimonadota bacterium]